MISWRRAPWGVRDIRSAAIGLVLLLALAAVAGASTTAALPVDRQAPPRPDVVGGRDAEPGAWPWQIALFRQVAAGEAHAFTCGGTLLDPEWVLTATHCVVDLSNGVPYPAAAFEVGVGMYDLSAQDGERVGVAQVVTHPGFGSMFGIDNDIALVRLAESVTLSERVQPVKLLPSPDDPAAHPGQTGVVTGWGQTDPSVPVLAGRLQQAEVPIIDCRMLGLPIQGAVCISGGRGTDTCHGDSGGPLHVERDGQWWQAGITSAGVGGPCGSPNAITFFTGAASYADWIAGVMADTRPMLERGVHAPRTVVPQQSFTYDITVRNTGREAANDLTVINRIPVGVDFVSADGGNAPQGGVLEWSLGPLDPGASFSASYVVREDPTSRLLSVDPPSHPVSGAVAADHGGAQPDVIGGRDAAAGAWPWQAAIFERRQFQCGASLIGDRWVLTAAHCLQDAMTGEPLRAQEIEVRVGATRRDDPRAQRRGATRLYTHGGWTVGDLADIGLIELAAPVTWSALVRPVALAGIDDTDYLTGDGVGTVTGWGLTSLSDSQEPDVLQQADLEILDEDACRTVAGTGREICAGPEAGGRSACFGDSGGPFVVRVSNGTYAQIGIVSRGSGSGCGEPGEYSLFSRVSLYHEWIAEKLATGAPDKIIVNDDLRVTTTGGAIEVDASPALTYVETRFEGPLPTPWPPPGPTLAPPPGQAIHLPLVTTGR